MSECKALVPKDQLLKYAEDAVQIESAISTIEQTIDAAKETRAELIEEHEEDLADLDTRKEREIEDVNNVETLKKQQKDFTQYLWKVPLTIGNSLGKILSDCLGVGLLSVFFGIIPALILAMIPAELGWFEDTDSNAVKIGLVLAISLFFGGAIICFFVKLKKVRLDVIFDKCSREQAEKRLKELPAEIEAAEIQFERDKQTVINRIKEEEEALKKSHSAALGALDKEIADLSAQLATLRATRDKFYALNIIAPKYRSLDCVVVLKEIFKNDLADTMREAQLLYDEWAFRGIVISGMQNILEAVGNLSHEMQVVTKKVDSIDRNVRMMSEDLYSICESMEKMKKDNKKANDELIRQSQATRYAAEQVAESNRRLEQHAQNMEFYAQLNRR